MCLSRNELSHLGYSGGLRERCGRLKQELQAEPILIHAFNFVRPSNLKKRCKEHGVARQRKFAVQDRIQRSRMFATYTDSALCYVLRLALQKDRELFRRAQR